MSLTLYAENQLVKEMLVRDNWDADDIAWALAGAFLNKKKIYLMTSGSEVKKKLNGSSLTDAASPTYDELQIKRDLVAGTWDATNHPEEHRHGFSYASEYCIRWALQKGHEPPWLQWAIDDEILPAEIREPIGPGTGPEEGTKKIENLYILLSIMTELMTNPDKKSNFSNPTKLVEYIEQEYEPKEGERKGLGKDALNKTMAKIRKARQLEKPTPQSKE